MANKIAVNVPVDMCFQVMEDPKPQIQGQHLHVNQRYRFMGIGIYKANTNVTISTLGSVAYWKC